MLGSRENEPATHLRRLTTQHTVSEGCEFSRLESDHNRVLFFFFAVAVVAVVRDSSKVCGQPGSVSAAVSAPLCHRVVSNISLPTS